MELVKCVGAASGPTRICLPFFPDPDGYWQTVRGEFLMVAYFTTPVEAFVQLHVLINTQENAGSQTIIDAGFFTSLWVLGGFIVSEIFSSG